MDPYEEQIASELEQWKSQMMADPSMISRVSKSLQVKINKLIPDRVHNVITTSVKTMFRGVIAGSDLTNPKPNFFGSPKEMEDKARERIRFYSTSSAAEGAITGAGGILLGLADFPLWLSLKMKMLFELSAIHGYDVKDVRERLFLLYIFQITFSNQINRNKVFGRIIEFETQKPYLEETLNEIDWKSFQIEYRDYLDIAKMLQLIPGIGAPVGFIVNHRLTQKLGFNAINAFRIRRHVGN